MSPGEQSPTVGAAGTSGSQATGSAPPGTVSLCETAVALRAQGQTRETTNREGEAQKKVHFAAGKNVSVL